MSSNSGLHALWSRASKRVPGVEAGQVGLEETSPGTKPQPAAPEDTSDEKLREKSAATAGFVQMADMQRDIPLMTGDNDKGQATGRKRKKASGPQAGSKRSKQNSIWTYPATPAEEEKLLELVEEEQSLLLEDLKHEAPLTIASQSTLDTTGLRRSIAEQIEESSLPYSSLAQTVFEKIAAEGHSTTPAAVRSAILSLAERVNYGAQNADADVLEDNAVDSCWKWEVRDVKLLAESIRDEILDRRKCRRKVSDRLTSLEGFATVLTNMHSDAVGRKGAFTEAAASLKKLDDRGAIVLFAEDLARKREAKKEARDAKSAAKEAERAAKAQEKEQQKLDKETEKEKQKAEKEAERLKLKEEKDRERAEKEAEKERARAEKEAQRQEKEAAREKEELEKDKLRAEREALEQKKKAQIKKSASIMDRFVIKRRPSDVKPEQVPRGIVALRLQGACGTCPSSTATMQMGIEAALKAHFGEALQQVVQVDKLDIGATLESVNSHLDILRPAITNYGGSVEVLAVDTRKGTAEVRFKGPAPIGMGIQAAIKDKFPDIKKVILVE